LAIITLSGHYGPSFIPAQLQLQYIDRMVVLAAETGLGRFGK